MRMPRMTTRRWMSAVAAIAVVLSVRTELKRIEQRRRVEAVEAEIRQLAQAFRDYHRKYPEWTGCRGPVHVVPTVELSGRASTPPSSPIVDDGCCR